MANFIGLHNHTSFSILHSLVSPKDLLLRAKELNQPAIAITDYGTFSGIWDAFKASKETGVKLIVGCEYYFVDNVNNRDTKLRHIILIAKNNIGYKNLLSLNRAGFDNSSIIGKKVHPIIDWDLLIKYSESLLCLTGCGNGIVGQLLNNKKFEEAENTLLKLHEIFKDDLGIEVQTHNLQRNATYYSDAVNQIFTNQHLIRLANKHNLRIVPTTNSFYLKKEDAETHDVLLAIGSMQPIYSNARIKYNVSDLYVKSADEVKTFFSRNYSEEFAEKICENTVYLADKCEMPNWVDPKYSNSGGKELPVFPVEKEPDFDNFKNWLSRQDHLKSLDLDKAYLRFKCGIEFNKKVPYDRRKEYEERLKEEFDVLEYHGFSSYMLIVADYINWAKKNGIRVGTGRGSVGGSLVAYLLGIHCADPIKYKLIFARFHNKEKTASPDIDVDFSPLGRDIVQDYIRNKYGNDYVAHVSNINTITPKVFVRDISRSCELAGNRSDSVKLGNEIADSIPKRIDEKEVRTYEEAIEKFPLFATYTEKYPALKKYSSICGKYRAWATHAAGLVISKRPLPGLFPLRKDKDGAISVEFDKDRAEENGLVKMDTLGLETLDIIDTTYRLIKQAGKELPPDPPNFDEYDKKTYDLISRGDTFCVFQLGTSSGTIELCRKVKPKTIEDISHINSLARPSARDIREDFIAAKEGKEKVKLLHPLLKRAFGDTFGFGLYEESLLYLAQDISGWSLHESDKLRKLTKEKGKNPKKALQWRSDFINDAKKNNNIDEKISMKVWDDVIDKFQGYGFNLSHSILYSMLSFHTAYLKSHYPVEFLLANLMSEIRSSNAKAAKSNIEHIKLELRRNGVKITPPDINKSGMTYEMQSDGSLLTGFEALKSVGNDAIEDILKNRPYTDFDDFMLKVNGQKVRSTTIQSLAASGCLDSFGLSRKHIYLYCHDYKKKLQSWLKKHDPTKEKFIYPWPEETNWSDPELYALERSILGEAFICNKEKAYKGFFDQPSISIKDIKQMHDRETIPSIRAEIKNVFEFKVKKEKSKYLGEFMIKATIEDKAGDQISLTIFPNKWKETKARMRELCGNKYKFEEGIVIHFSGSVNLYEDEVGIVLDTFYAFAPPPPLPKDLKVKKVAIKRSKKNDNEIISADINDTNQLTELIEDQLFDEGLIDLDLENDDI
jgi:DNA polymerase III subunit alpha